MQFRRSMLAGGSLLAAAVMALGGAAAASAGTHPSAAQREAAARALVSHVTVPGTSRHLLGGASRVKGLTQVKSGNWSGYADTGSGYSKVTSSWTEPSVKCTSTTSLAAFWVGIDGFTSSSVEQDGTIAECSGGKAYYWDWWEHYPANAVQTVHTIKPGDKFTSTVTRSGTKYTVTVTDSTEKADSFTKTFTCSASACKDTSAEWIAEAPSGSNGVYPLSDFGTWSTSGAAVSTTTKSGTIKTFPDDEITMVNSSNQVKAQPGALNSGGTGFSVTWKRSS